MDSREQQSNSRRRSNRQHTANPIYAQGIHELKKSLKKPNRKSRYDDEDSVAVSQLKEDSCSLDLEEGWLPCRLPEGQGFRNILITVVPPQRNQRVPVKSAADIKSSVSLRKKPSAFRQASKEVDKKPASSLLNILLGAAIKVAQEPHPEQSGEEFGELSANQQSNLNGNNQQSSNAEQLKRTESKQKPRHAQKEEEQRRYLKLQMKYDTMSVRFQQIKNKLSVPI